MVHSYVVGALATAGVVGGAYAAFRVYKRIQASRLPQKWKLVGTLEDIYIFPVKSCGGVKLDKAECTLLGLRSGWLRDRLITMKFNKSMEDVKKSAMPRFVIQSKIAVSAIIRDVEETEVLMVTDTKYNFITARGFPKLLTIGTNVKNSVLTLTHSDMEPLHVNLAELIESGVTPKTAQVWTVPVPVYDCGWEASEWFSRCLNKTAGDFRLVYYASSKSRELKASVNPPIYNFKKTDTGAFPDEVSYHLINEASVQDLNEKLEDKKVSHRTFRSNFTLKPLDSTKAFEEDDYRFVKIGENIFENIKACGRCTLTTLDPETGARDPKAEPLTTLRKYRLFENPVERRAAGTAPRMGISMALRSGPGGLVSLNDPIYFGNN